MVTVQYVRPVGVEPTHIILQLPVGVAQLFVSLLITFLAFQPHLLSIIRLLENTSRQFRSPDYIIPQSISYFHNSDLT